MNISAFSPDKEHYNMMAELYASLARKYKDDAELVNTCLCNTRNLNGLEVVIAHPEKDNTEGCWKRIKQLINSHPKTQFYLFTVNSLERKEFFGVHKNLIYIDSKNVSKIIGDVAGYIESHKL